MMMMMMTFVCLPWTEEMVRSMHMWKENTEWQNNKGKLVSWFDDKRKRENCFHDRQSSPVICCCYTYPVRIVMPASPLPGWCPVAFNSLGGVTAISDPSHLWPEPRVSNSVPLRMEAWSGPALNAKPKKHRLAM